MKRDLLREQHGGCEVVSESKTVWYCIIPIDVLAVLGQQRLAGDVETGSVQGIEAAVSNLRQLAKRFVHTADV